MQQDFSTSRQQSLRSQASDCSSERSEPPVKSLAAPAAAEPQPPAPPAEGDATVGAGAATAEMHGAVPHSFSTIDPSTIQLRVGPDYSRRKRKAPAGESLYDIVGME